MARTLRRVTLALVAALALMGAARAEDPAGTELRDDLVATAQAPLAGVWLGEARQYDPGRFWTYPMRLEVDEDGAGRVSGTLHWPTLNDSVSRFVGTRDANMLRFTEPELLRGEGIVLDGSYEASLRTPDRIEGTWQHQGEPGRHGFVIFELHRTALPRTFPPVTGWLGR